MKRYTVAIFLGELRDIGWHFLRYSAIAIALVIATGFWIAIGREIAAFL